MVGEEDVMMFCVFFYISMYESKRIWLCFALVYVEKRRTEISVNVVRGAEANLVNYGGGEA